MLMDGCSTNSNNIFSRTPTDASGWMKKYQRKTPKIRDKSCKARTLSPSPLIQCWLQISCSFLVFTVSHGFFRLCTTLIQRGGGFWVTLTKSNVVTFPQSWKAPLSIVSISALSNHSTSNECNPKKVPPCKTVI